MSRVFCFPSSLENCTNLTVMGKWSELHCDVMHCEHHLSQTSQISRAHHRECVHTIASTNKQSPTHLESYTMTTLKHTTTISASLRRSLLQRPQTLAPTVQRRFASQGYGDGEGSPVGGKPQDQGANPSADKEHPGPPPPKAGEGSGSSPTKGTADGHSKPKQDITGSNTQKRSFSTLRSMWADQKQESKPRDTKGLKPTILNESPPAKEDESEDVKKHNEDMANRHEKAHEQIKNEDAEKDKVGPGFWTGMLILICVPVSAILWDKANGMDLGNAGDKKGT
jgi:hypothetical protein